MSVARVSKLSGTTFPNIFPPASPGSTAVRERCPRPNPFNGARCRRRGCPCCGPGWVRSWEAITKLNIGALGGEVMLITITAPGADRLPWSCGREHRHSGARGCRVKDDYADQWAAHAPEQWKRLRDAARKAVKAAGLPTAALVLERVWEPQKRGVPHLHVVAGARTPVERMAAERFHFELHRLAPDYGFGEQLHVTKPMTAEAAARYLAGYLLGRSAKKGTIRDNLADERMKRYSLIWITPAIGSISDGERMAGWRERLGLREGTGLTMRRLRVARWYLATLKGRLPAWKGPRTVGLERLAVAKVAALLERGPPESWLSHAHELQRMRLEREAVLGT